LIGQRFAGIHEGERRETKRGPFKYKGEGRLKRRLWTDYLEKREGTRGWEQRGKVSSCGEGGKSKFGFDEVPDFRITVSVGGGRGR